MNKKYILLLLILILRYTATLAQLFNRPDSVSVWSAFSIGTGFYSGTTFLVPTKPVTYQNIGGYHNGALIRLQANITQSWHVSTELRYTAASTSLAFNDQFLPYYFLIERSGFEQIGSIEKLFFNQYSKPIVKIIAGAGYGLHQYTTYADAELKAALTSLTQKVVDNKQFTNILLHAGIHKTFQLSPSFNLTLFTEAATMLHKRTLADLSQVGFWRPATFRESSVKLGVFLVYQ
ncbi:MAG: hypothetical protein MUE96_00150 [Bacteroidia bacterium]|jgi:hypothetical protein|nr:hypothetical protein [Bacteroidia bacterium]